MLQNNNKYKVMGIFFDDPMPEGIGFQLREISRKAGIAPPSVKRYLNELEKEGIILKKKHRIHNYPVYYANRDNEEFRFLKKTDNLLKIRESGLLEYITDTCMPEVIILFGSASRGEDLKDSDIDLFVISKKEKINLDKFENRLNRKINIFFSKDLSRLSKELKNNVINGIILKGYLKVF